ncbi:tyrosine-type recombinase/integrase [Clostridium kluyveri]|uniref:Transposase B from transposon Tn554 n=2 Tax=Clostridium kluyveri TaxID=1534 RepID=A5N900_CLOK5|nr:tyrosine-type recombinase/integrase [Clostridium kluyveri]EDK33781.1 Transposase B from transposon Tn554 [Clostridium kluyveri DSM 555]BAH06663.1 hypothetical protein CKR_1612 [Clostridium kluyveri NBRC 12016]
MNSIFILQQTNEKLYEMYEFLRGYWEQDIWNLKDDVFSEYRKTSSRVDIKYKKINFSFFNSSLKLELKYFLKYRLTNSIVTIDTIYKYSQVFRRLSDFFQKQYPDLNSFIELDLSKTSIQLRTYLADLGIKTYKFYSYLISQIVPFYQNFYDDRNEFEKDTWDFRKIVAARYSTDRCHYYLHFSDVPLIYRQTVKNYMKMRISKCSHAQCCRDVRTIRTFLQFIYQKYPLWNDLKSLSRKDMEDYFSHLRNFTEGNQKKELEYLMFLKTFLEYIQKAEYEQAPIKPVLLLIFKEDLPKIPMRTENDIKYIPECVLQQLDDNLEFLTPAEYIPIVILLRATGWRISDILNLRYDNCLDHTPQGWYICGDIKKTQVLNHRVPITDEVAAVVKSVIQITIPKSNEFNNPNKLLFVRLRGKRAGNPPEARCVSDYLNRLAIEKNIIDDDGNIFHFKNHAFRHTKAIELINNGMSLLHVQKWMAHASPEMTLTYAKILDTTMRKSWEEVTKQGLFRIDDAGKLKKIDISDIENEDIIEWEYIRHNLDAVRMPLGYCIKPKKQECHTQLNPCLICRNLCTTPDFIPQFELEIQETKAVIERGKAQNRSVWIEKNQALLERYETILELLKQGKIHHKAGKKGREYTEEEKNNAQQPC